MPDIGVGIEALNVYAGLAVIDSATLFEGRGLAPERLDNIMMDARSVGLPFEDPVTNAVNAAAPILEGMGEEEVASIELLVVSTESGLDLSKSITSYVHEHLGLSRSCRILEVKQACYAATGVLQLAAGYLAAGVSPGSRALVIATDVSLVDARAGYAEPATGHGAVAVLLGSTPTVLAIDMGAFGNHSYETMDSARPTPTADIADSDRSLFAYLDCLAGSFADYESRVEGTDFATTFDHLVLHTPFAGLVKAAHRKMMRERHGIDPVACEADFARRVAPSLAYPRRVGNLCSGSVYLALASLLDHADIDGGRRVGLYSYGSGCASEFFSGVVDQGSATAVRAMDIGGHLDRRVPISFEEYERILPESLRILVPEPDRETRLETYEPYLTAGRARHRLLVHSGTKEFHRTYEWME